MVGLARRAAHSVVAPLALFSVLIVAVACGSSRTVPGSSFNPFVQSVFGTTASPAPAASAPVAAAPVAGAPLAGAPAAISVGSGAASLQDQMVAVIKAVNPSVVQIETSLGLGSGVIYDSRGDIVTNAHVVGTASTFQVTLADGRTLPGTLVGSYTPDDIAVIRISASGLTPATFGDSSKLAVGDFVLAMGNPLGLQSSVTEGIVSALNRQVSEPNGNALPDVIQTSAAINPGNSGGALVDLNAQVVGIPSLAATDPQIGGSAPGIGFAISSNRAKFIADQLIGDGKVTVSKRAYMGVQLGDTQQGAVVYAVTSGGPADKAGLQVGDLVISLDGKAIPDSSTLIDDVASHKPGDVIKLAVQHQNGANATLSLTLGQLPS